MSLFYLMFKGGLPIELLSVEEKQKLLELVRLENELLASFHPKIVGHFSDVTKDKECIASAVLQSHPITPSEESTRLYRSLCKVHHPDKGGDAEIFKRISAAYQSNDEMYLRRATDGVFDRPDDPLGFFGSIATFVDDTRCGWFRSDIGFLIKSQFRDKTSL